MKYCRHCGADMLDEAVVCIKCGVSDKSPVTTEKAYCRACGAEISSKAAVCVKCGVSQTNQGGHNMSNSNSTPLRRSRDGKILAGICSGMGKKWNVNPWVFRVILIITSFLFIGWFLDIAYIIAIFALPYGDE